MAKTSCPFCSFSRSWQIRRDQRKCKRCRQTWSKKKYPVSSFRTTEAQWRIVIGTTLRERTGSRVAEEAEVSLKTAQNMTHYIRECMFTEVPEPFHGIVEMDEAYIGGQRKNKKLHIRRIQGKRGHGTDKLPIVGLFSRESGKVFVHVEPTKLDIAYILKTIQERVDPGSQIYTDGFKMYRSIKKIGYFHEYVDHAGGEYVRGDVHTNNIEGFWGIMKRKMSCIGGMRRERLPLFVGEIVWKFNHRNESLKDQERALWALVLLK